MPSIKLTVPTKFMCQNDIVFSVTPPPPFFCVKHIKQYHPSHWKSALQKMFILLSFEHNFFSLQQQVMYGAHTGNMPQPQAPLQVSRQNCCGLPQLSCTPAQQCSSDRCSTMQLNLDQQLHTYFPSGSCLINVATVPVLIPIETCSPNDFLV